MIRFVDENETLSYRVPKSRFPILFMTIFFPIWLYFAYFLLSPVYKNLFLGDKTLDSGECFTAGLIVFVIFLPIVMLILLSYTLNRVVITDQRVYIRKGIPGRSHILNLSDIRSFQHYYSRGRNGGSNHRIIFYLSSGEKVKTGELFTTLFGLEDLLSLLREKFEGRGFTNQELKQMKTEAGGESRVITKSNLFALFMLLLPFFLALVLTGLYLGGAI